MTKTQSLWPRTWCAILLGIAMMAGCLDDAPVDGGEATESEELDGTSSAAEFGDVTAQDLACGPFCYVCGDGVCMPAEVHSCPQDCPLWRCGDGFCASGETALSCPEDCGIVVTPPNPPTAACGDGVCGLGETPLNCRTDCPITPLFRCGDGVCNGFETNATCPSDCP
jgi:hypothetical protein